MTEANPPAGKTDTKEQKEAMSAMYSNQVGVNFGKGLADPFIPVLSISIGATTSDIGWLQAVTNLFPAALQVPWGKFSDLFGRRIPFLVVGGVVSFILYFFMIGMLEPWQLIVLVAVQLSVGSMMIPTWSALVGDRTTARDRGSVMARFFVVSSIAGLIATILAGVIANTLMPKDSSANRNEALIVFALPFFMAGISGIIGSIMMLKVKERKRQLYASPRRIFDFGLRSFLFTHELKENKPFRDLVILNTTFNFIMSIIWPVMYFTYFKVLGASLLEYAIMSAISTGSTLFFQTKVGKLLDLIGPMPQILISRFAYISVPIVYALATQVWHIYLINGALGFANAMANVAFFAYILDVAPDEKKAEYFAVYNTLIGVGTFIGSILGGYLASYFYVRYGGDWFFALGAVYAISAFGRIAGAVWFFKLKDPVKYPETLRGLTMRTLRRWRSTLISH